MQQVYPQLYKDYIARERVLTYTVQDLSIDTMIHWSDDILDYLTQSDEHNSRLVLFDVSDARASFIYLALTNRDLFNVGITHSGRRRLDIHLRDHPDKRVFLAVVLSDTTSGQIAKSYNTNRLSSQIVGKIFFEHEQAFTWLRAQSNHYTRPLVAPETDPLKPGNAADAQSSLPPNIESQPNECYLMINGALEHVYFKGQVPVIIGRENNGASWHVDIDVSTYGKIGRSVSRRHASLHRERGQIFVTDLNSTNGTFVDGERIRTNIKVPVGKSTRIRFGHLNTVLIE